MPKKTSEELREKVVSLRKQGATYTQIEKQVLSPETGQKLARPTLIKILREAGLTKSAPAAQTTHHASSASTPTATPSKVAPTASPAPSDGVADFMPAQPKKPMRTMEWECDSCGAEFIGQEGDELPETCPACGV